MKFELLKYNEIELGLLLKLENYIFKIFTMLDYNKSIGLLKYPCKKTDDEIGKDFLKMCHVAQIYDYADFVIQFNNDENGNLADGKRFTPDGFELYFENYSDKISYDIRRLVK